MPNTLDTDLIVDVLAETAITKLNDKLAFLSSFSTDFSNTRAEAPRQTIQVELVTSAGAILTNPANFEVTDTTNVNVPVVSNHLSRPVGLSAQDMNLGHRLRTKATQAAITVANAVQDAVLSLVTLTNFTNSPVIKGAQTDAQLLQAMWASIKGGGQKNAVLTTSQYAKYLPTNLESFDPTKGLTGLFGFDSFTYSASNSTSGLAAPLVATGCPMTWCSVPPWAIPPP
jgi:hypothetical protein